MDEPIMDRLVTQVEPEFRGELATLVDATAPDETTELKGAGGPLGGMVEQLTKPILQAAAKLILAQVQAEAMVILNAEKVAHPGLDLSGIEHFVAGLSSYAA